MYYISPYGLCKGFERFEKAAIRGHEESQWIWNVVKDMELEDENREAIVKAFAETESPLGFYIVGELCEYGNREEFDYMKKSSDGGCSWGQVEYAEYFNSNDERGFVEKDEKMYLELIEKAAVQNNPDAIYLSAVEQEKEGKYEQALGCYRRAAELGWPEAKRKISEMSYYGRGGRKDLVQAVYWDYEAGINFFWWALEDAATSWNEKGLEDLGCDFNRLAMEIGKGSYWYQYGTERWEKSIDKAKEFGVKCLDNYCETIELQQEAIFLFLLFWNKATGVKGPGQMIGQMVWEERYDCLVKEFGDEEESEEERGVK